MKIEFDQNDIFVSVDLEKVVFSITTLKKFQCFFLHLKHSKFFHFQTGKIKIPVTKHTD